MRNNDERTGAVQQTDSPAPAQTQKGLSNNLSFVAPTEFVEIPSRGKFYPQGHPLHGKQTVEIKHMTAKEEDILTSQTLLKKGVALDRFLQSVMLDKSIDISTLLVGDKNALIVKMNTFPCAPGTPDSSCIGGNVMEEQVMVNDIPLNSYLNACSSTK